MTHTLPSRLFADLIGKPWVDSARGPDAYDCLGLAIEVTRRRGHVMPAYLSDEATLHREMAADGCALGLLTRVPAPEPGDIVLLRSSSALGYHLGVMVDSYRMLHASEPAGAVVLETISRTLWKRRVLGFYRMPNQGGAA